MSGVNVNSEEGALEKGNVTVPAPAAANSEPKEQKVVLQPGTNLKLKGVQQNPLCGGIKVEDVQVNIIGSGCIVSGGGGSGKAAEDACGDDVTDTECSSSSSFGDTGSDVDPTSEFEEESPMSDDLSRIKKTTTMHWRRFIHPIRWRCKWIELQLNQLNSLAREYNKELEAYDYKKQLEFSKFSVDDFNVKSVPISDGYRRNKVMKRRKRSKAEECDSSSYMSNHCIFSYYENKNHSHDACLEDFRGEALRGNVDTIEEFKFNDVWSSVDHVYDDKSIIDIIQRIEELQSQVEKLKTRIDNVVSDNPRKFCSVTQLSMVEPSDGFNHSGHNSTFAGNDNIFPVSFIRASSQHKCELNTEDLLLTENTLSTPEGMTPFIETTSRPLLEVPQKNIKDEVLIQNQADKEELLDYENIGIQLVEKTRELVEVHKSVSPAQALETDMDAENAVSTLKACSTSKSNSHRNIKRGRKKSGQKRWRRR
ncbi:hypothetical protein RJT34_18209 [Clitoria ternatea]|uniref:Uncharacterized protein n=1 Tax=Clitoria ternatea TaxID=43366 RepID=A0AAN9JCK9_CLITE